MVSFVQLLETLISYTYSIFPRHQVVGRHDVEKSINPARFARADYGNLWTNVKTPDTQRID